MLISLFWVFQFGKDPNLNQLEFIHEVSGFHRPEAMVLVDGSLWVLDSGALYQIELDKRVCRNVFEVPSQLRFTFLSFGDGVFLLGNGDEVWVYKPQNDEFHLLCYLEVVDGLHFSGGLLWVTQAKYNRALGVSLRGEIENQVDLPASTHLSSLHKSDSKVWLTDVGAHALWSFDQDWQRDGDWGPHPGFWDRPSSLDMAADGRLLVCDQNNQRLAIKKESWSYFGGHERYAQEGLGKLHYPKQALFLGHDYIAVLEPLEDRVQIVTPSVEAQMRFSSSKPHFGLYMSLAGLRLAVADPIHFQVLLLDLRYQIPVLIHQLGYRGQGPGQFTQFMDVSLTDENNLWILDGIRKHKFGLESLEQLRFAPRLSKFVSFQRRDWTLFTGGENGWAVRGDTLVKLKNWEIHQQWDTEFGWGRITDMEVDRDGSLWVLDQALRRIVVFKASGEVLCSIDLDLLEPFGLALNADQFCVSDQYSHSLNWFTRDGNMLMKRGSWGQEPDQMVYPADVDWSDLGRWFVVDSGNHRLIAFRPDGQWDVVFTGARSLTPETYVRRK